MQTDKVLDSHIGVRTIRRILNPQHNEVEFGVGKTTEAYFGNEVASKPEEIVSDRAEINSVNQDPNDNLPNGKYEEYKEHDYSDNYFKPKGRRHGEFPIRSINSDETEDRGGKHFLIIPETGRRIKAELMDLALFYESEIKNHGIPSPESVARLIPKLYSIARENALGPDDPDDHDHGKDAEKFVLTVDAILEKNVPIEDLSPYDLKDLVLHTDILIAGMHAEVSWISEYVKGNPDEGFNLMEAAYRWNGDGRLWGYYVSNWKGREKSEREHTKGL